MTKRVQFGIGWLAAQTERSVHTIRWYEQQGLLPGVTRDAGRRRAYHPHHVQWLELMDRLRHTGMSIAEMRRYTALVMQGVSSLSARRELLATHRARIVDTLTRWESALDLLDRKLGFYAEWEATGKRPRELPHITAPRPPRHRRLRSPKSATADRAVP